MRPVSDTYCRLRDALIDAILARLDDAVERHGPRARHVITNGERRLRLAEHPERAREEREAWAHGAQETIDMFLQHLVAVRIARGSTLQEVAEEMKRWKVDAERGGIFLDNQEGTAA